MRTVRSWWGWPVPATVRTVTATRFQELVQTAAASGFSRCARGVLVEQDLEYLLFPQLPEMSPSPCWICTVVAIPASSALVGGSDREIRYDRLDVSVEDFRRLPHVRRHRREELLNWLAYAAFQRRG
ncbi:hypothetical protein ABGB16_03145 [Micromonospora sp. B11E3]|uniref:hypothetical protein n=1 Tax=Micromonospora sp. B11E3 TaxID=3153562 RepID=UPI00325DCB03